MAASFGGICVGAQGVEGSSDHELNIFLQSETS
jgi:hypothetical protein